MDKIESLKKQVERRLGKRLGSPADFDSLALDLVKVTGKSLSVSTIKRLWGYVPSEHEPAGTTLDILARYAGYRDWESFRQAGEGGDISYFTSPATVVVAALSVGTRIRIAWEPDRECTLAVIEGGRLKVEEATNSKLLAGDILACNIITLGEPLYCSQVVRDGRSLPMYVAARSKGLAKVEVINP